MNTLKIRYAILVYQAGIANVFAVASVRGIDTFGRYALGSHVGPEPSGRLLQSDYRTCESFARGLQAAGCHVQTAACNEAGDIADRPWSSDLSAAPWSESFRPVNSTD